MVVHAQVLRVRREPDNDVRVLHGDRVDLPHRRVADGGAVNEHVVALIRHDEVGPQARTHPHRAPLDGQRGVNRAARANAAKWSPHLFADKITTPTFVITNELDFRVPVDQGLQLFTALRRHGVPSEALVFPDEGHWVLKPLNSQLWHQKVFGWMATHLK